MVTNLSGSSVAVQVPLSTHRDEHTGRFEPWGEEFVLTELMRAGDDVSSVFRRLKMQLLMRRAEILSLMIYGDCRQHATIEAVQEEEMGPVQWPVTWIEGGSCVGAPLAGIQAFCLSNRPVTRIQLEDRIVGSVYENADARHCLLGGLGPVAVNLQPTRQFEQMFARLECGLASAGLELADIVRTWFYNDNILAWYDDFNRVRSTRYQGIHWRTGSLPASTGIGARNPAGAALQVALWAVKPLRRAHCVREIASPLQCPAPAYGSSFSRAMEIESGAVRRLLVSGTASIHPDGKTAWKGAVRSQIDLTMEVVSAILQDRGLGYGDISRATCYFRQAVDWRHFADWLAQRELTQMPVVYTQSVICREDLLFEIELDACRPVSRRVLPAGGSD